MSNDHVLPLNKRDDNSRLFPLELVEKRWEEIWTNMPLYEEGDAAAIQKIIVHFRTRDDVKKFAALIGDQCVTNGTGSKITEQTDSMWFGKLEDSYVRPRELLWITEGSWTPRYPIYIPSVGRWGDPRTSHALQAINVPHYVVVEPAQHDNYAAVLGEDRLLILPEDYSLKNTGSIPARNWIWEHSLARGDARHWVIDDNVSGFLRVHRDRKIPVSGPSIFCAVEDFTDRWENVAFSGFSYMYLAKPLVNNLPPFFLNSRVYSMILVNNSLPYRWRGRYNEDTDICLRALKDSWCTILFNAFLGDKASTMSVPGGNTDTIYATGDNRRAFAESLVEQHPDVAKVVWRYNRWHHEVNYSRFRRNRLVERTYIPSSDPEYGMRLVRQQRSSRYPKLESVVNGNTENRAVVSDQARVAGSGTEGDFRTSQQGGLRRQPDGGIQRRRGNSPPTAWRP